jgi:hypothetical protein
MSCGCAQPTDSCSTAVIRPADRCALAATALERPTMCRHRYTNDPVEESHSRGCPSGPSAGPCSRPCEFVVPLLILRPSSRRGRRACARARRGHMRRMCRSVRGHPRAEQVCSRGTGQLAAGGLWGAYEALFSTSPPRRCTLQELAWKGLPGRQSSRTPKARWPGSPSPGV